MRRAQERQKELRSGSLPENGNAAWYGTVRSALPCTSINGGVAVVKNWPGKGSSMPENGTAASIRESIQQLLARRAACSPGRYYRAAEL